MLKKWRGAGCVWWKYTCAFPRVQKLVCLKWNSWFLKIREQHITDLQTAALTVESIFVKPVNAGWKPGRKQRIQVNRVLLWKCEMWKMLQNHYSVWLAVSAFVWQQLMARYQDCWEVIEAWTPVRPCISRIKIHCNIIISHISIQTLSVAENLSYFSRCWCYSELCFIFANINKDLLFSYCFMLFLYWRVLM